MHGHTYSKSMDQPDKVASPARGQLDRKNEYFPVRVRALEFGFARHRVVQMCVECSVWESRLVCKKAVACVKFLVPD